jgi:hypothetical protein
MGPLGSCLVWPSVLLYNLFTELALLLTAGQLEAHVDTVQDCLWDLPL